MATSPDPHADNQRNTVKLVATIMLVVAAGLVLFHTPRESNTSTNVMSRWATVEALVDHGTYAIDDTKYATTIDKVQIDGKMYSSKPPLLPTIVAAVYAVYRALTGDEIGRRDGYATWVSKMFTMFVWYVLLLVYFVKVVKQLVQHPGSQILTIAAMCFAYLGAGYATTLNNHTPAALVGLIAFYYALRARRQPQVRRHWIFAGLAAGAIPALDLPLAALSAGLLLYLFLAERRETLRLFLPAMMPMLALHLGLTWAVTGSIVPVYMRPEVYQYPGSYWATPHGVFALHQPKWLYGFHLLLGHHGFFTMTPLLILAAWGLISAIRGKAEGRAEALLVGAVGLVLITFYITRTSNYGGRCLGARWLVPYTPLLLVFFGVWLDRLRRYSLEIGVLLAVLFLVSQFNALEALQTPWQEGRWHEMWRNLLGSDY